jgi:hypothetical protein|tara:strand:+ start:106 stop:1758 length:1653 start_codon:yes stop_codon:yes gene_type:complete
MDPLFFKNTVTKSLEAINSDERYFEGILTVQMKDKQNEITITDELMKVLPIWMDRGAPITDTHSNRVVGKGINFARLEIENDGDSIPAIKITGKIHKNYDLDDDIWEKIKSGEYKGLSFGGATKSEREPVTMKDGSVAYALKDLEHYEVAVCEDPAVPLALITDYNALAKSMTNGKELGNGKMLIKCEKFGCLVEKDANLSEEDTFSGKVSKLIADGKTKEQAEKIVGSFVKDDSGASDSGKEGVSDPETDGNSHSQYNQDVDENASSGRKIKEEWQGSGHPQPKEIPEDKNKDGLDNSRGMGVRGLGGYNTAQQGSDPIASITETEEKGKYINPEKVKYNNNMADEKQDKIVEEEKADIEEEEKAFPPKDEKDESASEKSVDAIKTSIDSLVEQIKSLATGQTGVSDTIKSIDSRLKALETPSDLPLKPSGSESGDDVGADVKVPAKPYPQGDQSGLDSDRSGDDKPSSDQGKLRSSEKTQLVQKSSHTFTTETPRPGAALETVEKSTKDYSPILKDARAQGFEGLSKVAQDILAGKYYKPSDDEVRGF